MVQLLTQIDLPAQHVGCIYTNYENISCISEYRLAKWLYCDVPSASMAFQIQKKNGKTGYPPREAQELWAGWVVGGVY